MKQVQFSVDQTDISVSLYRNTLLVVVSELGKFGSLIVGECEDIDNKLYDVKTKFGNREIVGYEIVARGVLDEMYDNTKVIQRLQAKYNNQLQQVANPFCGKTLHLFISLGQESKEKITKIVQQIGIKLIDLF